MRSVLVDFFKVGVVEKSNFFRRKEQLQKITNDQKLETKRQMLADAIEKVKTNIVWPRLPADNDSDGGSSPVGFPAIAGGRATTAPSIYTTTLRRARRTPMDEILSPNKDYSIKEKSLARSSSHSLVDKFPKASQATRDFLAQIEDEERKLRQMRPPRLQDGPRAIYGASLDDWAFSDEVAEEDGSNRFRNLTSTTNPNPASRGFGDRPDTHAGGRREVASRAGTRGGSKRGEGSPSSRVAVDNEFGAEVEEEIT